MFNGLRQGFDAVCSQLQTIQHGGAQSRCRTGGHVDFVGGDNFGGPGSQIIGDSLQPCVLFSGGEWS